MSAVRRTSPTLDDGARDVNDPEDLGPRGPNAAAGIPIYRWLMAGFLLVMNVADVYLTKAILARGGVEANPIMRPVIGHAVSPVAIKVIVSLGVGALLLAAPVRSRFADVAVTLVVVIYVLITGWNIGVLLQSAAL
jgi:hypothetical protein